MDITYLGAGSVRLSGRQINVLADPFDDSAGLGKLKTSADVTLFTSPAVKGEAAGMRIDGPGEYEVKGSLITGVQARLNIDAPEEPQRATIYQVDLDDVKIVVLGNVAPELTESQIEQLGRIDVLIVPVGNHGLTLDAAAAAQVVSRLEPKYVVPVHYDDGVTKYPMPQDGVGKFLDEMGSKPESVPKLKLSAKELPEETTVVVLERAGA